MQTFQYALMAGSQFVSTITARKRLPSCSGIKYVIDCASFSYRSFSRVPGGRSVPITRYRLS